MTKIKIIKKIYSKNFFILLGIGFLPLIWKILEISLLAGFDNAIKILGQLSLLTIIFKVFEESLLNPLYKMFNNDNLYSDNEKCFIAKRFLFFYFLMTTIFTLLIFIFNDIIIYVSCVPQYIFKDVQIFFKIYIIACGIGVLSKYIYTFNIINKNTKKIFWYFLIKLIGSVFLLLLLIPKFALGLGVNGVAITELIINLLTVLFFIVEFVNIKRCAIKFNKKQYFKLLFFAFLETFIRNLIYYFVILVLLNKLDNQDLYFVANEYIWSFMLIPVLAQSTLVKQEIANNSEAELKPYFINSLWLIAYMIVLIPFSLFLFKNIYYLPNYMDYFYTLIKLFPGYIIFVFDSVIESYLYSRGLLQHILIQNLITNIGVYLISFIMIIFNVLTISLNLIILLFNLGLIVSSVYTIIVFVIYKNKR
jgi:hypothetical protein